MYGLFRSLTISFYPFFTDRGDRRRKRKLQAENAISSGYPQKIIINRQYSCIYKTIFQ